MSENYSVKRLIEQAFMDLLDEKAYIDISVTDIVKKAMVSRTSYYRHFSSINDIVESITDNMVNEFFTDLVPMFDHNDDVKLRNYLNRYFTELKERYKPFPSAISRRHNIIFYRLHEKLSNLDSHSHVPSTIDERYSISAKMSLIHGIGNRWLENNTPESVDEMVDYTMRVIRAF